MDHEESVTRVEESSSDLPGNNYIKRAYIFFMDMDMGICVQAAMKLAEAKVGKGKFHRESVTHWTLGLRFGEESAVLVDFSDDVKGRPAPTQTWTTKDRLKELKEECVKYARLTITEDFTIVKLGNELSQLCHMGNYVLLDCNCQEGLKKLLDGLKLELPPAIKTLREAINSVGADLMQGSKP
ncbi:hypothetical protein HPB52_008590 [Rhipicephalus sanguineus]|uniref:Uncharacterized protein n=1 Tax=Rhipicephalus sanguineus TaxID=34632 RepID=A0A9D4Q9Z8_RHISA|nr:hypothetical protein HPB52_008590 [Rhipicephalus sanguineus]